MKHDSRESRDSKKKRASAIATILRTENPDIKSFLNHRNTFELLIAVILSAQCTDERVNLTTPALFEAYPSAKAMANASLEDLEKLIKSINYFRAKSANIKKTAQILDEKFGGEVPATLDELITLAGVGRKTANVVLGQAFGIPGITVDTHIKRVTRRLGFTKNSDPVKIEFDLQKVWPTELWNDLSTTLILLGRSTCKANRAFCERCVISSYCKQVL
jgi:endonuclease-3